MSEGTLDEQSIMTIEQANHKLKLARIRREKITAEIRKINDFLRRKGMDSHSIIARRNKEIFKLHLKGMKYSQLAICYSLSAETISTICKIQERKRINRKKYQIND